MEAIVGVVGRDAAKEVLEVPHGGRVRVYGRTRSIAGFAGGGL
jgi:hypothetical protein